ncbi:DUF305 domain-containing protein [Streptomyces sp. NPDC048389]|uniref:DUF305 domain-containing protein n=1 Tax=Streptomyces sp. NPDC048389 TaxID=3154622 RepID=UPI003456A3FE
MTAHRSTMRPATVRRVAAVAAAATAAVVLAACGGGDDNATGTEGSGGHNATSSPAASAPTEQGEHNAADVAFAQGMIPHHRQAVEMADLAETRAQSTDVKALAAQIKKAQDPEIRTLSGWLASWGEEVPKGSAGGGHAGHSMPGMMTDEDVTELEKSSGRAFDTAFLDMMVRHHEGAVDMARTEQADGSHRPARAMAGDIVTSQSAEITRMKALLGKN